MRFSLKSYKDWCDANRLDSGVIIYEGQNQEFELNDSGAYWYRDGEVIEDGDKWKSSCTLYFGKYITYLIQLNRNNKIEQLGI